MSEIRKPRPLSRKVPWQLVALFALIAAGISVLSRTFYVIEVKHSRAFMEGELATVAGLKAEQIKGWRERRLAFARALQEDHDNAAVAKDLADDASAGPARARFLAGMRGLQKSLPFTKAAVVMPGGRILAVYPEDAAFVSTDESLRLGDESRTDGQPALGTVVLDERTGSRSVDMMVPLFEREGADSPVALLRMSFDAAAELDPILNDWPNRRESMEALLLSVENEKLVRLSRPGPSNSPAPPPPIPVASLRRPASDKAVGQEGLVEGTGSSGRPVLEYLRAVPDTPWLVAVKADLADLTSRKTGPSMNLALIASALIFACGTLLYVFWRRNLAAQEHFERTKWDDANANMDEFVRQLIEVLPNPAFFKDARGLYQGTNAAFERLLGLSKKDVIGKALKDVASAEIAAMDKERDLALLAQPGHQIYEAPLQAWDGLHQVIFIKSTYQRPDGTIGGIIGILKDITQRLRAEEELEQLRKFSDSTVRTMTEGLVLTNSENKISFVNPAAAQLLGYTPAEMVEQDVLSFIPKDQHAIVKREEEKRAKGISDRFELVFQHRDGSRRTFLVSGGPRVQGAQFGGTLAVLTDITGRKAMEEEIKALSLRDEMTTLYNRRGFLTLAGLHLKTANRLKKKLAVLYLDVDNLKQINDSGGHKLGDRALNEIAFILKKSFREFDIVGRLGGDEFAVLVMETTRPLDAGILVKRLQEKLDLFNARSAAEAGFALSASVGVFTRAPDQPVTIEEMLSRADTLMYEQKRARKGGADKPPGPSK